MLSTDSPFRVETSSSLKNPLNLNSFYRPWKVDGASSINSSFGPFNKYRPPQQHPFNDGHVNFFGKLTDNVPTFTQASGSRFQFRNLLVDHQPTTPSNDLYSNFDTSTSLRKDLRYKPYAAASKDRRLDKILYKSVTGIDDISPIPNKYAGLTIQDKLARLKTIIGCFGNRTENSTTERVSALDKDGLKSILRGFNPTETSTPMPNKPSVVENANLAIGQTVQYGGQKHNIKPNPQVTIGTSAVVLQDTPSSSKAQMSKTELSSKAVPSSMIDLNTTIRPVSVQQQWREKKYTDERLNRQKEAEELEKEVELRTQARYNRGISEEENRRLRLKLEGLVLERRVPPKEEFPELSFPDKQLVKLIWNRSGQLNEVFASGFGADLTRKDLLTLCGQEWLNDEVINFFLNLIVERNKQDPALPKAYTFNTFFYQKLSSSGYAGVKRWTRKVNIFENDLLIVPVHLPNHWCLAMIDLKEKRMDYYDSLGGENRRCLELLSEYLCNESMDKRNSAFELEGWQMICRKDVPHQTNFSDCGMFSCIFAEYASRRAPMTFGQKHIPYFRERMVYEICKKKLL